MEQEKNPDQNQDQSPKETLNDQDATNNEDDSIDFKMDPQMIEFIEILEENIYDDEMLFMYMPKNKQSNKEKNLNEDKNNDNDDDDYLEEEEEEKEDNKDEKTKEDNKDEKTKENQDPDYHQVYTVAVDFVDELKKPISLELSTHCFNNMTKLITTINNLLNYQEKVPYKNAEIENWRNIMMQTLKITKTFYIFLKNEKNKKCIEIAESLLDFAFNVDFEPTLESKIFSVLPELSTFLYSNEPLFSLESSTGSGKTRCVPFFLSIRSYQEKFARPFIIMTQPSTNLIVSKVKDFKNILKNAIVLTDVDEIIKYSKMENIQQPILCLLTPYNSLNLIEKAKSKRINLFKLARWVLDEVHDRTIYIDTIIGFLHQELDRIQNFPCQITLMTATMDKSIQNSLKKKARNILLNDFTPYYVKESFDRNRDIRDVPLVATDHLFKILDGMLNKKIEPGHIIIFIAGNADCQIILKEIASRTELMKKDEKKKTKLMHITVNFNDFIDDDSVYQEIERETLDHDYLYVLPIQLAGYVSELQKYVAQNPLPKYLNHVVKIIISTNIIESSITILDLAAVIDTGLYNRARFDPETEITKITKESISRKMATQRRGRVGRTRKGVYVGITIGEYQDIEPQIKTGDLSASLLLLKNIGIDLDKVEKLPDKPDADKINICMKGLMNINALDYYGYITKKGREISILSNDFSPFFASVLYDIKKNTQDEYYEILAALIILIITSQQLIFNQRCLALQKNYDKSSDIITILKTFNDLFEENYQNQKEKCVQYGFDQISYTHLITSFSNFIHKIFHRDPNDRGFLGRHVKKVKMLISKINLMEFINFVIDSIKETKPNWIMDRTFSFTCITGLENIPSVFATNSDTKKTVIIGSRPGWKGLECDDKIYVFSLIARNQTVFGSIVHKCPSFVTNPLFKCPSIVTNPSFKCISFEFNENIAFPFFSEVLKCLNSSLTFLPMFVKPTNQPGSLTSLIYLSSWMNSNYLSICTKYEYNIDLMKRLINRVKLMMPFIGKSILVDVPEYNSVVEIFSIGSSQYSTKIYSLNEHLYAYEFNQSMFDYLFNQITDLSKTDSPIRIAINFSYVISQTRNDINPFIVLSNNEIKRFTPINLSKIIKPQVQKKNNPFIEDVNSIAPNIIIVQENSQLIYSFIGEYQKINDFINNIVKTNIIDDKIVKNIEINKIIYGKDINYDVEATRINREISKNESKIKSIIDSERSYQIQFNRYQQYKNIDYPKLSKKYKIRLNRYKRLKQQKPNKKLIPPKEPKKPKEPQRPDFNKNKQTIENCNKMNIELKKELKPMNIYFQNRKEKLINELRLNGLTRSIKACGSDGCVISMCLINKLAIHDTSMWKCDSVVLYDVTITHHLFHSMPPKNFKDIITNVCKKFGIFVTQISQYNALQSFGQLGYINVQIAGKQFVIPFIKTVLDELDKGAIVKKSHEFELPSSIISNIAISHPANKEYFIKLMRKNNIDITLNGPIISGSLNDVRNAYQLINQRRTELLFPFFSIKIPKFIFADRINFQIMQANRKKPSNKQWIIMKTELVFPREDLKECQSMINALAGSRNYIHGCIYFCDNPLLSNRYLPVYYDRKTPILAPYCVNCLKETLHYATDNFFDVKRCCFSKEFLENNVEIIPPISICEDRFDQKTSETWPIVPLAQLISVLQYEPELNNMSKAWVRGVIEQTIQTCPSIITRCPDHPQKKFVVGDKPIRCACKSCKLCFCLSCRSWHDPDNVCEKFDKSFPHCPKCGIPTIKSDGCNHIQCKCGAHWCYKCGAGPFIDGSLCYDHMTKVHNSFVD